jgi:hypothetical protein
LAKEERMRVAQDLYHLEPPMVRKAKLVHPSAVVEKERLMPDLAWAYRAYITVGGREYASPEAILLDREPEDVLYSRWSEAMDALTQKVPFQQNTDI